MQTVDRITNLLEFLSKYKDGIGINEISESLDLPLSTTHRMLNSLKKSGYVSQDNLTKRYKLGIKVLSLAINLINDMDIIKIAKPIIEDLSTKYGQLVYLSVLGNDNIICVDMVNNAELMKYHVKLGFSMPVHCSASGKSIAAYMDESKLDNLLQQDRKIYTRYTKLDTYEIKKELSKVKEVKYAVCNEEMEIGVKAIATPIFKRGGKIVGSITILFMKQLECDEKQIIEDFKIAANKISEFLGYVE